MMAIAFLFCGLQWSMLRKFVAALGGIGEVAVLGFQHGRRTQTPLGSVQLTHTAAHADRRRGSLVGVPGFMAAMAVER